MKLPKIKEVIKHFARTSQDPSGEYTSDYDIDFLLDEPQNFVVLGINYTVDRIKMHPEIWTCDELGLHLANEKKAFENLVIPKKLLLRLYRRLLKEEKGGCIKGWNFADDVADIIRAVV